MMSRPLRIVLIEDHKGFRRALVQALAGHPDWSVVATYGDPLVALRKVPDVAPDLLLVDKHLPGISGVTLLTRLKTVLPDARFLMLTVDDRSDTIVQALEAGADGYLLKGRDAASMVLEIEQFLSGKVVMSPAVARRLVSWFRHPKGESMAEDSKLTERQWEILKLASRGMQQGEIAMALEISVSTVKNHFRNIYDKLQVHSLREALIKLRQGRQLLED